MSKPRKKRKPRAKKPQSSPVLIPTVITTSNGYTNYSSTSSDVDTTKPSFQPVAKEEKKKVSVSTKFIGGLIHAIPDGMLLKVGSLIFGKLIGKIPDDKRDEFWEGLQDYSVKLAGAVTEGAARGMTSEIKNNYSR